MTGSQTTKSAHTCKQEIRRAYERYLSLSLLGSGSSDAAAAAGRFPSAIATWPVKATANERAETPTARIHVEMKRRGLVPPFKSKALE